MFESTLKKVLTCGKSITILTLLKKQSYKNTFQEMVAPTDLYDKFLANLKQNLSIHNRQISVEKYSQKSPKKLQSIPMLTEGPSVSDIIGDISEYDQDLIAAYDVIAADLPELETTQELQGQSWQTGFFELARRDRNMKVRFFWEVVLKF